MHFDAPLKLHLLHAILQNLDLVLNELSHKLAHLILRHLAGLVVGEEKQDVVVLGLKISVGIAFPLSTAEESPHHVLNDVALEHARAVLVHGEEEVPIDLLELVLVDQDVSQVLDGLLVIDSVGSLLSFLVVLWVCLTVRIPVLGLSLVALGNTALLLLEFLASIHLLTSHKSIGIISH